MAKKPNLRAVNDEPNKEETPVSESKEEAPTAQPTAANQFDPSKMGVESKAVAPNPFDPSKMRLSQEFVKTAGVRKLNTTVPVRKPHSQEFVRVRSEPEYRETVALLELKEDRETYLVNPEIAKQIPDECYAAILYTAITRQGTVFLWPVRLPRSDNKQMEWHRSANEAAERAMKGWIRIKANMSLGAYDMFEPEGKLPDPEWPATTFYELELVAFKAHYIGSLDHTVIVNLRGRR
jgi:hypothetical protein